MSDPTDIDKTHNYLSTACFHDLHEECRATCKFCGTRCSCPHHNQEGAK